MNSQLTVMHDSTLTMSTCRPLATCILNGLSCSSFLAYTKRRRAAYTIRMSGGWAAAYPALAVVLFATTGCGQLLLHIMWQPEGSHPPPPLETTWSRLLRRSPCRWFPPA